MVHCPLIKHSLSRITTRECRDVLLLWYCSQYHNDVHYYNYCYNNILYHCHSVVQSMTFAIACQMHHLAVLKLSI